jgi:hypothetical protein
MQDRCGRTLPRNHCLGRGVVSAFCRIEAARSAMFYGSILRHLHGRPRSRSIRRAVAENGLGHLKDSLYAFFLKRPPSPPSLQSLRQFRCAQTHTHCRHFCCQLGALCSASRRAIRPPATSCFFFMWTKDQGTGQHRARLFFKALPMNLLLSQ